MLRIDSFREKGLRYPLLRLIIGFCMLFGVIFMGIAVALLVIAALTVNATIRPPMAGPPNADAAMFAVWGVGLLVGGFQTIAAGSFLQLMIHVEENTRISAQSLDLLRSRLEDAPRFTEGPFRT